MLAFRRPGTSIILVSTHILPASCPLATYRSRVGIVGHLCPRKGRLMPGPFQFVSPLTFHFSLAHTDHQGWQTEKGQSVGIAEVPIDRVWGDTEGGKEKPDNGVRQTLS